MSEKMKGLKCKECERLYPAEAIHVCEYCFGPLEVDYNYDFIKRSLTHGKIESGPHTLWRYWDLLPVKTDNVISIHEGMTPLFHARRLGKELGLSNLFIKNDAVNPTYSLKTGWSVWRCRGRKSWGLTRWPARPRGTWRARCRPTGRRRGFGLSCSCRRIWSRAK